jgi:hypothetical protein
MAMDVWAPTRHKDVEMVAYGDGGGYLRLYELRVNPMVRVATSVIPNRSCAAGNFGVSLASKLLCSLLQFVTWLSALPHPQEDKTSNDRYLDNLTYKHKTHSDWVTCVK